MSAPAPRLVLASGSVHRRTLLERLRLPFDCCSPQVDETCLEGEAPAALATRLGAAKARAVAEREAAGGDALPALVIGGDQVADCAGTILGKPGDLQTARRQLSSVSGKVVRFHTSVHVVHTGSGAVRQHLDETRVRFRPLDQALIERYLAKEPAFDCAGSFKSEGLGIALVEEMVSDDPTALIGLPLIWLSGALRTLGLDVP